MLTARMFYKKFLFYLVYINKMMRLNQSRRGCIGYVNRPMVNNDISRSTMSRNMALVQKETFEQDMSGQGFSDTITKHSPVVIDAVVKGIQFLKSDNGKGLHNQIKNLDPERVKNMIAKFSGSVKPKKAPMTHMIQPQIEESDQPQTIGKSLVEGSGHEKKPLPAELLKKKILQKLAKNKKKQHKGGFIFTLAGIIAAISASASAVMATTVVGSVTVGTLVGATATGIAGGIGTEIVKAIAGNGIKDSLVKVIKETKITLADLPTKDKIKLKAGFEKLKKNPTRAGVIELGKKLAPVAREVMKKKLETKINELSGSGLKLSGSGAKKFDNDFVKNFAQVLTK